jgi:hypothetical protein
MAGWDDRDDPATADIPAITPDPLRIPRASLPPHATASRVEVQPSQVVAAAGSAVVAGARMGRLFGRAGWRLAKQLPGAQVIEREAHKLQNAAAREVRRLLEMPPPVEPSPPPGATYSAGATAVFPSAEEQRAVTLIHNTEPGRAPLRSAMEELLERSVTGSRSSSRDYLFGTIISQLVPDEARILAALADGSHYAAADLVARGRGRHGQHVVVANASTVGRTVGVGTPDNVPTYLTRLHNFGLIDFGPEDDSLDTQYDILGADDTVRRPRDAAGARPTSMRLVRKTVFMSQFGREFWAAADPSRSRS